jgi:hypothetical protein
VIKLIHHTGECDHPDDTSLPVRLDMYLRTPSFMSVAFVCLYGGSERVVARAENVPELEQWMLEKGLTDHSRLSRFQITEGTDVVRSHNWPNTSGTP